MIDADRQPLHSRSIEMQGFSRGDGLYEVEGKLVDRKPRDFFPFGKSGRFVEAHEPIHEMVVRVVYDERLVVRAIESMTAAAPYTVCHQGGQALQSVVGLAMASGWSKEIKEAGWKPVLHPFNGVAHSHGHHCISNSEHDKPNKTGETRPHWASTENR